MEKINLGTEKISKLLKKFAIPCIISLIVNALYNMVDQIFIGNGVGYLGNGATNIIFPITVICLAVALMFGDGTSAFLSLKLGENKKEEAEKGVASGIVVSAVFSVIIGILMAITLPQLIKLFGCTDVLKPYALSYGYIILIGVPYMMIGTTLNSIIRSDGSPQYSMMSMVVGAVLNIILDPIFIFVFKKGVEGAAIATVIGQIVSFIINILYIRKMKTIKITLANLKPDFKLAMRVATLGISSFITQMSIVVIIAAQNSVFSSMAYASEFEPEIPITVLGIVMKINQILNSIIIGISVGSQPIIGFNYGAKKYDRVKQTLKIVLGLSFCISLVAFILFQTIPEQLIKIFGSADEKYNKFACLTFRIYLMLTIVNGIQIASGIFFQAIGKPVKSAFITLSRQIIFAIPAIIILSKFYNVMGVLYSGPVADALAFLVAATLLVFEVIKLSKKHTNSIEEKTEINVENNENAVTLKDNLIITISREYGSGGRYVGKLLAEKLNLKFYDKDLIKIVSNESGLSAEYIEEKEQKIQSNLLSSFNVQYYNNLSNDDSLFLAESKAIEEIADKGNCVIIGRCANYILRDRKNVISIFLYSSDKGKVARAVEYYGLKEKSALRKINKINKARDKHYKHYTNMEWKDLRQYDISVNVDEFGIEKTVENLIEMINKLVNSIRK